MRMIVCLLGVTIAGIGCIRPATAAPVYRWCASYEDRGDMTCAYDTFQQCLDTARGGAGGMCMENPAWRPAPIAPMRHKTKRKAGQASAASCPRLSRASTSFGINKEKQDVDGRA